jgi:hypothetical protein
MKAYINTEYSELPEEKGLPYGMVCNDPVTVISYIIGSNDY